MKKILLFLIVFLLCAQCQAAAIAQFKCNDNAATTVVLDSVGDHNGVLTDVGGTATTAAHHIDPGCVNTALEFDGSDDHIIVGDHNDFTFDLSAFSISLWVDMDSAVEFRMINKLESNKEEWTLYTDAGNLLRFEVWDASEDAYIGRYYNTSMATHEGSCTHIVATYDGDIYSAGCKLYVNASQVDSHDQSANLFASMENLAADVRIGQESSNNANGRIDNVVIYNEELVQAQITRLYNDGDGTEETEMSATTPGKGIRRFRSYRARR